MATDLSIHLGQFVYGYGGQALLVAVCEEAKKLGIGIVTGYGPSETLTAITRMVYIPRLWMRMGFDDEKLRDYFVINNSLGVPVSQLRIHITKNSTQILV